MFTNLVVNSITIGSEEEIKIKVLLKHQLVRD